MTDKEDLQTLEIYEIYIDALERINSGNPRQKDEEIVEVYLKHRKDRKAKAMIYHAKDIADTKETYK